MKRILVAAGRYIQGPGVMAELGQAVKPLGGEALVLWDKAVRQIVSAPVLESLCSESIEVDECIFPGEATQQQRRLVAEAAKRFGAHNFPEVFPLPLAPPN